MPTNSIHVLQGNLNGTINGPRLKPFSSEILTFFENLSSELLFSSTSNTKWPDAVAFGSWIRKANLRKLSERFSQIQALEGGIRLPRGLSLQFAPSNVEGLFLYSWALSVLLGNQTIVRLSSRRGEMSDFILSAIEKAVLKSEIIPSWTFVDFERSDVTAASYLSNKADFIVIWGGDIAVKELGQLPRKAKSRIISFPDRESISVLDESSYVALSSSERDKVADLIARDIATFGQQACSSPKAFFWISSDSSDGGARDLYLRMAKSRYSIEQLSPAEKIQIHTFIYASAAQGLMDSDSSTENFGSFTVTSNIQRNNLLHHPGLGLILEHKGNALSDVFDVIRESDQTITYFGVNKQEIADLFVDSPSKYPLRVVPVGQAVEFDYRWDGLNLLEEFTQLVTIS